MCVVVVVVVVVEYFGKLNEIKLYIYIKYIAYNKNKQLFFKKFFLFLADPVFISKKKRTNER